MIRINELKDNYRGVYYKINNIPFFLDNLEFHKRVKTFYTSEIRAFENYINKH